MLRYLDIKGMEIVDTNGTKIGIIEDCIADIKTGRVCSAVIKRKGIKCSYHITALNNIKNFKGTVICSENYYNISKKTITKISENLVNSFLDREIIDINGQRLGCLIDIILDKNTGKIKALICSRGIFDDIFYGRKIIINDRNIVFGKDKIITDKCSIDFTNNISFKKLIK